MRKSKYPRMFTGIKISGPFFRDSMVTRLTIQKKYKPVLLFLYILNDSIMAENIRKVISFSEVKRWLSFSKKDILTSIADLNACNRWDKEIISIIDNNITFIPNDLIEACYFNASYDWKIVRNEVKRWGR